MLLFVAGAVFGEVQVSLFVAGAVFGEIWNDSQSTKCCIFRYKMLVVGVKSNCENHARKMRTFFTRRLEPKTKSSNVFKWSLRPKRK